jgi:hypothetical protein
MSEWPNFMYPFDGMDPELIDRKPQYQASYQARDYDVVDYAMYALGGTDLCFRGPPLESYAPGDYFTCLGAAQTFGCFCPRAFPDLLAERLGLPALNLGYGGAGPEFFANNPKLDRYINGGRFVILQVMSGRSQSNSRFESNGLEYLRRLSDDVRLGANQAYKELMAGPESIRRVPPRAVSHRLARLLAVPEVRRVVAETRQNWVENYRKLLARIEVPVILFWFAKRQPDYVESWRSLSGLFGDFPQLVNAAMFAEVRSLCDHHVSCVTQRGCPQPLFSRFSGEPISVDPARVRADLGGGPLWTHNRYYPSPEMQQDAADALLPTCETLLAESPVPVSAVRAS